MTVNKESTNMDMKSMLLKIFQKLSSSKLSIKEYAFAIMVTLIQIVIPFVYELIRGNNARGLQIPITGVILYSFLCGSRMSLSK